VVVITIELVYNPETVEATKEDLEGSESFADTNFDDDIPF
jgi:hypothetical protein